MLYWNALGVTPIISGIKVQIDHSKACKIDLALHAVLLFVYDPVDP